MASRRELILMRKAHIAAAIVPIDEKLFPFLDSQGSRARETLSTPFRQLCLKHVGYGVEPAWRHIGSHLKSSCPLLLIPQLEFELGNFRIK